MHKLALAVCAEDEAYLRRLSEYLISRRGDEIELRTYSEKEAFHQDDEKGAHDAALVEAAFLKKEMLRKKQGHYLLLSEGEVPEKWKELPAIYKFQSADNLLREVFSMTEGAEGSGVFTGGKELIAVYSPHQSEHQISFSLRLSEELAGKGRVLYLNLMDCAGFEERFGEHYTSDIGDLIYYAKTAENRFEHKLHSMIYRRGAVDYVPPARNPENLHEAMYEDYERLIRMLCERTDYEEIVLDFGFVLPGFAELLTRCDRIICPVRETPANAPRIYHFREYLSVEGNLLERTEFTAQEDQSYGA